MKLSEILNEIRKGKLVFSVKILSPKGYDSNVECISIADTLFYKKNVAKQSSDEVIVIYSKEFNISEFTRQLSPFKNSEIRARLNNEYVNIEID